jgi:hypothetical protein
VKRALLEVLSAMTIPCAAVAQVTAPAIEGRPGHYQSIRTWHEQYLATSPDQAGRVDALRKIVRTGTLGERGLQRIFNNFDGRMSIDPSIPGVERTARLLASSNRSQVKGHTRELLYAIRLHDDGRNQLVEMGRKLQRPWGKTDADIVIRNHRTGLSGRIEVKNYSLRSQITNEAKLMQQMNKMALEGKLTGQAQFWINRHGMTAQLRKHAERSGIVAIERVATGHRLPANIQPFDTALTRMDEHFARIARQRAIASGASAGIGMQLLTATLPATWAALEEISAPGEASVDARLRLARNGSYSLGAAGLMASGSALTFASGSSELIQTRMFGITKVSGLVSLAALGTGIAIDVQRYRNGSLAAEQLWNTALRSSGQLAAATAGGWLGGSLAGITTANPIAIGAGSLAGSTAGAAAFQLAGNAVANRQMRAEQQRFDQAFGDTVRQRYGVPVPASPI